MRAKVMQSRLINEVRAAEVLGGWLKTILERDVKAALAEAICEVFSHARLLSDALERQGVEPYDYRPLPAQMAISTPSTPLPGPWSESPPSRWRERVWRTTCSA